MVMPNTGDGVVKRELIIFDAADDDHNYALSQRNPARDKGNCKGSDEDGVSESPEDRHVEVYKVKVEREEIGCESEVCLDGEFEIHDVKTEGESCSAGKTSLLTVEDVTSLEDSETRDIGAMQLTKVKLEDIDFQMEVEPQENIKSEPIEQPTHTSSLNEASSSTSEFVVATQILKDPRNSKDQSDQLIADLALKRFRFILPKGTEAPSSSKSKQSAEVPGGAKLGKTAQLLAALKKLAAVTVNNKTGDRKPTEPDNSKPLEALVGQAPLLGGKLLKRVKSLDEFNKMKAKPTSESIRRMRSQALHSEILRIQEIQRKCQSESSQLTLKKGNVKRKSAVSQRAGTSGLSPSQAKRLNQVGDVNEGNGPGRTKIIEKIKECSEETEEGKIYCKDCKRYVLKKNFYCHVKFVHFKVRDHLCEDCGYRATNGYILREHIKALHSTEPPTLACTECDQKFRCVRQRRSHMRSVHKTKARSHICQFCGKGFFESYSLREHIRTHTQETPFKCRFCDRRFTFRWACVTHERLHTGVKPYKCRFCSEAFTHNCVRKNHEYRAHGNEEFNPKKKKTRGGLLREKKKEKKLVPSDVVSVILGEGESDS